MQKILRYASDIVLFTITNRYLTCFEAVDLDQTLNLKAYSLMLNRGRSQNFQTLNFLQIFVTPSLQKHTSSRNWAETISVWNESNFHRKSCTLATIPYSIFHFFPHLLIFLHIETPSMYQTYPPKQSCRNGII